MEKEKTKEKKICFIITPIGNDTDPIRRHIDGVIDECIIPVLGEKYKIGVSHRMSTPGSITNQIIAEIYNADLVIANLTTLNPNVMYELAFRHAVKKPVIIIMQKDTGKLPFDTVTERTIFYTNDFTGAIELKEKIAQTIETIEGTNEAEIDNPIYAALERLQITENVIKSIAMQGGKDTDAMQYIIDTLQRLENKVNMPSKSQGSAVSNELSNEEIYVFDLQENYDQIIHDIQQKIIVFKSEHKCKFVFKVEKHIENIRIQFWNINKMDYKVLYDYLEDNLSYRINELPFV